MILIKNRDAFLEGNPFHLSLFTFHLHRSPPRVEHYPILSGFHAFFEGCGHNIFGLQREHSYFVCTTSFGNTCRVNGYVSSADHNYFAFYFLLATVSVMEEVNCRCATFEILTFDTRQSTTLTTNRYIESFVSLFTQLGDCDVLATNFDAALNLNTYLAHNIDLGINNRLVKFVRRDTIPQHSTRLLIALKDSRLVTHRSQVIRTTETGRPTTDDGNLLFPTFLYVGTNIDFRNETCLSM